MLEGEAEAITAKVVQMALDGDRVAIRLCLERLISVRAERALSIDLPIIETAKDGAAAMSAIIAAVAAGDICPNEGIALSELVTSTVRALEVDDLEKRIEALEEGKPQP